MADTQFDADEVRDSAATLAAIMDDTAAFDGLEAAGPMLGSFPAARSLQQLVDQRRAGVTEYARQLKAVLDQLQSGLTATADGLERADRRNAAWVGSTGSEG